MQLIHLEVTRQSKEHDIDKMDLDYAVKYIIFEQDNRQVEAETYRKLIKEESKELWTTAKLLIKGWFK